MTTHASHTEEFTASCGTCLGDAKYQVASDAPMTVNCPTCDPPEPASYRWLRDVDTQRRRA